MTGAAALKKTKVSEEPHIPMGYKQTESGFIPADWVSQKLADVATIIRGASPRPKGDRRFYGGSIPRLMVEDVTRDGKYVFPQIDFLTDEGAKRSRPCKKGTLTIVCSGTVGIPSFLGVDACIHDGFLGLVNVSDRFSSDYIYHQFVNLREALDQSATHGGIFTNLTTTGVKDFAVSFPSTFSEQQAIATALSDADALIEGLESLVAKKHAIKQGAMQELLTGKRRLHGFSGEWQCKKLNAVGTFLKGSGIKKDEAAGGTIPCVRYGEIYTRHDDVVRQFFSSISKDVALTSTRLKKGDLLFAGSGETKEEIGKCVAFIDECEAYAGGDIVILRPMDGDPLFLGYYLNTPEIVRQKASRGQGDAVVHISAAALGAVDVNLPDKHEQRAIAATLSDMDAEIFSLEAKLAKARQVKQGMMQELLTGRIRLV